jgi:hypothetical protein
MPNKPLLELAIGTLFLIVIMFVHGIGVRYIGRRFNRAWVKVTPQTPHWRSNLLMSEVIAGFTALHLFEPYLWALFTDVTGAIPGLRDSYFFVLESYTTLGDSSVVLPNDWRLLGPMMAISGLFTFGWTGSVLVGIMSEFGKLDRSRAGG